jgi:glycosyltransferase involved in cell wall biosynthesis
MRILHVHKYFHNHDGASRYMVELMQLQASAGHTVAPFATKDHRNFSSHWDKFFVSALDTSRLRGPWTSLKQLKRAWWSREAKQKLTKMLKVFKPDVVHVHNLYTHLSPSVLVACRRAKVPVVMTVHDYGLISANYLLWSEQTGVLPPKPGFWEVVKTKCIKNSWLATLVSELVHRGHRLFNAYDRNIQRYLVASDFVKQTLVANGFKAEKILVVPLFAGNLLPRAFDPKHSSTDFKTREGVLFAGRLETAKGLELMIQAAAHFKSVNFYIAGTGQLRDWLQQQLSQHANIIELQFLNSQRLWQKMSEVKVLVMPSRCPETFGLTAIEAMALGTPVIVSDVGGLAEKVKPGQTGWVFKVGDLKDLTEKITEALRNIDNLTKVGDRARKYAEHQANPNQHVEEILVVYKQVIYPQVV